MKTIYLILLIFISFSLFGQGNSYRNKTDRKALETAYKIIQVYYSEDILCVSDSVYDQVMFLGTCYGIVEPTVKLLDEYRSNKNYTHGKPTYSKYISKVFGNLNCNSSEKKWISLFFSSIKKYDKMRNNAYLQKSRRVRVSPLGHFPIPL